MSLLLLFTVVVVLVGVLVIHLLKKFFVGSTVYIDLVVTLIGAFVGFTLALYAAAWQKEKDTASRLKGMVNSALQATSSATRDIEERINFAEAHMKKVPDTTSSEVHYFGSHPLNPPQVLPLLLSDGELYQELSPPFQSWLVRFIDAMRNYESMFNPAENRIQNLQVLKLFKLELQTQTRCLELELERLSGNISSKKHEVLFAAAIDSQAIALLGWNRSPSAR